MEFKELDNLLVTLGYPVAYHSFKSNPKPPYIVYLQTGTKNLCSDNKVYFSFKNIQIEVYTLKKDGALESKVEELLNNNDICWEKSETYINDLKLFRVLYEIEI